MEKIDTPFGIHAEFVSDRAVKNCINMYKKEQKRITPGKNGPRARVSKHLKDSLDLGLEPSEITKLLSSVLAASLLPSKSPSIHLF